jgi:iron complex outermembrane receptor protein
MAAVTRLLRAAVAALALDVPAHAAAAAAPPRLPEVTVSATRAERDGFEVPASIDVVPARAIREAGPQVDLSEALARVPGVLARDRHNHAQDLQISSRGFGARASFGVRGLRLVADGIPATMPDGQGQAASFALDSAQRIEVLRGPFSALHGNAAGGVIQLVPAPPPASPTFAGRLDAGADGARRLGLRYGARRGALGATAGASRFETDGYRAHGAARRDQANARLLLDAGARGSLALTLNALEQPGSRDPLGLTAAEAALDPRQAGANAVAFNTRKSVSQHQGGLRYALQPTPHDALEAHAYLGSRQVTQFLAIPLAAQAAPTASGGVVDLDRGYGGGGVRWTRSAGAFAFTAGAEHERMAERRRGYLNLFGAAGALKRDEDDTVVSSGVYAQLEWEPAPRWLLLAGLRHSRVRFEVEDYFIAPGNPDDGGTVCYARTTPSAGVVLRAAPALRLYASAGKGFETPTFAELAYRPGGAPGLNFALQPADSLHREAGAKLLLGAAGRLNLAAFRIDTANEIVVNRSAGGRTDFRNAARTRREGVELAWEGRFSGGVEAAVAVTRLDARYVEPFGAAAPVAAGNRLPGVPAATYYAELAWRDAASGFHAAVEARGSAKTFVNDANSEAAGGYALWHLRAGFEQRGAGWRLSQFVRLDNALDRRYIGSVIVAEASGRYYEPAPGRSLLAGATAEWLF